MANSYNPALSYDYTSQPTGAHGINWVGSHQGGGLMLPGLNSNDPNEFYQAIQQSIGTPWEGMVPDWARQVIQAGGGPQQLAQDPGWSQNLNLAGGNTGGNFRDSTPWGQQIQGWEQQQQSKQYASQPGATQNAQGAWQTPAQADFQAKQQSVEAAQRAALASGMQPNDPNFPGTDYSLGGTNKLAMPQQNAQPTPMPSTTPPYATATPPGVSPTPLTPPDKDTKAEPSTPQTGPTQPTDTGYDGQTGVTNPTPYPHEYSPQPYDGDQDPQGPGESVSQMASRHIARMRQQEAYIPALIALATQLDAARKSKRPSIGEPLVLEKAGWNPGKSIEAADTIIEHDGDCADTAYAGHIRAPLGGRRGAAKPRSNMSTAGGLNSILAGLSGANRRGQIDAGKVGEPGVAFDGKFGQPPPGTNVAPMTVPTVGHAAYDAAPAPGQTPQYTDPSQQFGSSGDPNQGYNTGAQNLGAPISPWLMPWQGNFTAPMSDQEQQGLGGMSDFVGGGMNLGGAQNYNDALLGGQYIGAANPYMNQIQSGMQTLKDNQDQQAKRAIGSSMAAGGNALSGARMSADQQYQNLSDANFNQNVGNMQLQNLTNERRLQNAGVGQAEGLANTTMGGYQNLMNAGALPRQLEQNDTNAQYADWLRQIGSMNQTNQNQQQLANNILHTTYPGSSQPNYGQSSAQGYGALIASLLGGSGGSGGGGGLLNTGSGNGGLLSTNNSSGLLNQLFSSLFGGDGGGSGGNQSGYTSGDIYGYPIGPNMLDDGSGSDMGYGQYGPDFNYGDTGMYGPDQGSGDPTANWSQNDWDSYFNDYFGGT